MKELHNVIAKRLSSYKGGGTVGRLYLPESAEEFAKIYKDAFERGNLPYVLGGGSNTLICDGDIRRTVISTQGMNEITFNENLVTVGAGVRVSTLLAQGRRLGLSGLEFLSGVPASIGGILKMNAGAYSSETKDYVDEIYILSPCGAVLTVMADEIDWGYRRGVEGVILGATLRLTKGKDPIELSRYYLSKRLSTQPRLPSLGSVFKRAEMPAYKYVEGVRLKGEKRGGAEISSVHGNFIVNLGGGNAEDYLYLVTIAERRVFEEYGVTLEREFVTLAD